MAQRRYTGEQFAEAVQSSVSIRQVLSKLGLHPTGANYEVAKRRIRALGLDDGHFTGQGHLKGKTHNWRPPAPLIGILVEDSTYAGGTYRLKHRLIKEGLLEAKCHSCGLTEWLGRPIPLELEHKNGRRTDNRIANLTLLCANCHSLTDTFAGKNKRKIRRQAP